MRDKRKSKNIFINFQADNREGKDQVYVSLLAPLLFAWLTVSRVPVKWIPGIAVTRTNISWADGVN